MDFNTLNISEKDFKDVPILDNVIDLFFSEVEILLTTDSMDVLGQNDFGFQASKLIWQLNASEQKIKSELIASIERYCRHSEHLESWDVDIKFMQGSERDIALIDITAKPYGSSVLSKSFIFD